MSEKLISELRRKEIFLELVKVQDGGTSVVESRKVIAQQFGLTEPQIRRIEQEGLDYQWPPL
jgi:hypothetical protein